MIHTISKYLNVTTPTQMWDLCHTMIDIFDIKNLPDELELVDDLHIFGSDWYRKKGDIVPVSYNFTKEFWGKLSGNYYPPKVISINIEDCEYPIEFYPICFKLIDKHYGYQQSFNSIDLIVII